MIDILTRYLNKRKYKQLYEHIPNNIRGEILSETKFYDRIGPISIPSSIGNEVHNLFLYYYIFHEQNNEYFLITRNNTLHFSKPIIRISSNCFYGFITNSKRCDCKWQFDHSLELLSTNIDDDFLIIFSISDHGKGIQGGLTGHALLYAMGQALKQELITEAYIKNGFSIDNRNYRDIDTILKSISVSHLRLLTNNPDRLKYFIDNKYIVEQLPIEKPYDKYLSEELGIKKEKLGHNLNLDGFDKNDIEIYGLSKKSYE